MRHFPNPSPLPCILTVYSVVHLCSQADKHKRAITKIVATKERARQDMATGNIKVGLLQAAAEAYAVRPHGVRRQK